ncbi:hypothetical protein [Natrononativus amylolyticus]|uniref:hypothetical protein n=1 Tax=Natrononativus amylolyticus TaxID=2963434 RepID=UPI0020CCB892|nr:hypothetical protein [Natrononativus amylolyticus]
MVETNTFWDAAALMTGGAVAAAAPWAAAAFLYGQYDLVGGVFGSVVGLLGVFIGFRYVSEGISLVVAETVADELADR